MAEVSRRAFLHQGAGAAAAGAVIASTGLGGAAAAIHASDESPEQLAADAASLDGAVVVHIKDATSGEVSIFSGEDEIACRDPKLVARVARATRGTQV